MRGTANEGEVKLLGKHFSVLLLFLLAYINYTKGCGISHIQ
jgi:hypothetical protein